MNNTTVFLFGLVIHEIHFCKEKVALNPFVQRNFDIIIIKPNIERINENKTHVQFVLFAYERRRCAQTDGDLEWEHVSQYLIKQEVRVR